MQNKEWIHWRLTNLAEFAELAFICGALTLCLYAADISLFHDWLKLKHLCQFQSGKLAKSKRNWNLENIWKTYTQYKPWLANALDNNSSEKPRGFPLGTYSNYSVEIGIQMWRTQLAGSITCHITTLRDVSTLRANKKFKQFRGNFRNRPRDRRISSKNLAHWHVFFSPDASWNNFVCCILNENLLKKSQQICMKIRNNKLPVYYQLYCDHSPKQISLAYYL